MFKKYLNQAEEIRKPINETSTPKLRQELLSGGQTSVANAENVLDKQKIEDYSFNDIISNSLFDKLLEYHSEEDETTVMTKKEFFIELRKGISINKKPEFNSRIVVTTKGNMFSCGIGNLIHEDLIVFAHMFERIPLEDDTLLSWPEDEYFYLKEFACFELQRDKLLQSESYDFDLNSKRVNQIYGNVLKRFNLNFVEFNKSGINKNDIYRKIIEYYRVIHHDKSIDVDYVINELTNNIKINKINKAVNNRIVITSDGNLYSTDAKGDVIHDSMVAFICHKNNIPFAEGWTKDVSFLDDFVCLHQIGISDRLILAESYTTDATYDIEYVYMGKRPIISKYINIANNFGFTIDFEG